MTTENSTEKRTRLIRDITDALAFRICAYGSMEASVLSAVPFAVDLVLRPKATQ